MKENSHIIGIAAAYAGLFLLLIGHFTSGLMEYVLPTSIGLAVVGVLMPLWYLAARTRPSRS